LILCDLRMFQWTTCLVCQAVFLNTTSVQVARLRYAYDGCYRSLMRWTCT